MSTRAAVDAEAEFKPTALDIVLGYANRIAVTLILLSMPRLPEIAGKIAVGIMLAIFLIQFGRDFLKGVEDAGGWSGRPGPPNTAS